jgi:hypothetical protein
MRQGEKALVGTTVQGSISNPVDRVIPDPSHPKKRPINRPHILLLSPKPFSPHLPVDNIESETHETIVLN